jgi:hypothetical protein
MGECSGEEKLLNIEFENLYPSSEIEVISSIDSFNIIEYEIKLDNRQYLKYAATGNTGESCMAKRINFENNTFIYATETHRFIFINELIDSANNNPNIYRKKIEFLRTGDLIAFINTDRDVLVELVKRLVTEETYEKVIKWINLWKSLIENKFAQVGYNFQHLVRCLRQFGCARHIATIRTWINDENMIGPANDNDIRAIARMADSNLLFDNIENTRMAIRDMISWRMQASDIVRDKIKTKLLEIRDNSIINSSIEIPDLGRVEILKVREIKREFENIDKRYLHHLISEEFI